MIGKILLPRLNLFQHRGNGSFGLDDFDCGHRSGVAFVCEQVSRCGICWLLLFVVVGC